MSYREKILIRYDKQSEFNAFFACFFILLWYYNFGGNGYRYRYRGWSAIRETDNWHRITTNSQCTTSIIGDKKMEKIVAIISTLINRVNAVDSKVDELKANVGVLDTKVVGLNNQLTEWAASEDRYHMERDKGVDTNLAELLEAVKATSKAIAAIKVAGQTDTISDTMSNELDKLLAEANGTETAKPAAKKTQKKTDKSVDKSTKDKKAEAVIEALEAKTDDTSVDDELDKLLAEANGTTMDDTKVESDNENGDSDEITIEELKAQFEARSSQERRLVCQSYLKYKGRPEEARVPTLLNWEHCETVGEEDEFAQYVLDYEDKMNK